VRRASLRSTSTGTRPRRLTQTCWQQCARRWRQRGAGRKNRYQADDWQATHQFAVGQWRQRANDRRASKARRTVADESERMAMADARILNVQFVIPIYLSPSPLHPFAIACCSDRPRRHALSPVRGQSRILDTRRTSCRSQGTDSTSGTLLSRADRALSCHARRA